jgi:hypothetical protein
MPPKVALTRPNGTVINVNAEDADQFKALGYQEETPSSAYNSSIESAREDYFTGAGQRTVAGLEGFVNGLTVGGYTTFLGGSEDEQGRAEFNPGTRLGGEIVGAILPSLIPGGAEAEAGVLAADAARAGGVMGKVGRVLDATPMGMLSRGAEDIAGAATATKTGHALVKGAVEGAVMGAGSEATNAKLSGDPVTAESVLAGMGWGALWGGGLGYVGGKLGVHAEKVAAEAASKAEAEAAAKLGAVTEEGWSSFRNAVDDVHKTSKKAIEDAKTAISQSADMRDTLHLSVLQHADALESESKALFNRIDIKGGGVTKGARGMRTELKNIKKAINIAVNDEDFAAFEKLAKRQTEVMGALSDITKVAKPELQPFVLDAAQKSNKAIKDLSSLTASASALDKFPFTADGFRRMGGAKMEKISAAVDDFISKAPEEMSAQKAALSKAVDDLATGASVQLDQGTPGQKVRATWEKLKSSTSKAAQDEAARIKSSGFGHSTAKYVGGITAAHTARNMGGGIVSRGLMYEAGSRLAGGLLALKTGVLGTISGHVNKWTPQAAKALKFIGPKVDPLRVRLDGTLEEAGKSRKELMQMRMEEMRTAAPTIKDTLFRAVEPIAGEHPEFAAAIHKAAADQFIALFQHMPRDPGKAFANMKSLWTPDGIMMESFARTYEVFHNPVGVAARYLEHPNSITIEGSRALQQFNPQLFTQLRVEMIQKLGEPGVLENMSYSEQVGLGQLLDLRIHSTQDPEFIQAQLMMFQNRKEPLPARPSAGNNSNNPSGTSQGMTASQRITEH